MRRSICRYLSERFGGIWKYDGSATWWCDDGERRVSRCSAMFDDEGIYPPQYWLYGEGTPRRVRIAKGGK